MKLKSEYTLTHHSFTRTQLSTPLEVDLGGEIVARIDDFDEKSWHMSVTEPIDPAGLRRVEDRDYFQRLPDGTERPIPTIDVQRTPSARPLLVRQLVDALAFLMDGKVSLSVRPHDDRLLPDSDEDRKLLESLGTDRRKVQGVVEIHEPGGGGVVTAEALTALMPQHAGLRLFADAGKSELAISRYREYWKVLESAFGAKDADLLEALGAYEPIQDLVQEGELKQLHVLRGRASHAESKAGVAEQMAVERLCKEEMPKLKRLAERVIMTKASWGYPTNGWR